ncbi:MAG: AMP-binding protein [Ruminococcus flavefaciens]|nr:AMP-binding protein [Ruminococcus flavefaciens]
MEYIEQLYGYGIRMAAEAKQKEMNGELALLLPTSGSTGDCKFVRQSKKNIISNAKAIIEYLHVSEGDRAMLSLPLSYTFGLSVLHTHIMSGAALLVPYSKIYQSAFWDFFQKYHGSTFSGVPYTFEVLDKLNFFSQKINARYITQAGGKLSMRLQDKILDYTKKNKIQFYIMYGQTEATARMTYLPPEYFASGQKRGSVGIPILGGKIEIHHLDKGEKEAVSAEGEIIYKGGNVCLGYANDYRDLSCGDDNHGILETGDIGYLDQDGFLYITGRKKRFVKILGKRINLDDIELKIKERFCIPCAVVGNDSGICVYVDIAQTEEILNYSIEMFHVHAQHIRVKYIQEIPKLQSGKNNYSELLCSLGNSLKKQ